MTSDCIAQASNSFQHHISGQLLYRKREEKIAMIALGQGIGHRPKIRRFTVMPSLWRTWAKVTIVFKQLNGL